MRRFFESTVAFAILSVAVMASAEEAHVRARLVCDAGGVEAEESFALGVLFEPKPGWHIYWRNPGEAGLSTEVDFALPEGFEVGELRWPTPVYFEQPGGLAGYGYEEPVVLAAEVVAPAGAGPTVAVKLSASWLACKDVCVYESAELVAELPLAGADLDGSGAALERWRKTLPAESVGIPYTVTVSGGPVPDTGAVDLVVWLSWSSPPGAVEIFPDPGSTLKIEGLRTRTRGTVTRIDFNISRLKTRSAPAAALRSLIVVNGPDGQRLAEVAQIELDSK